ncbi:MAG: hypothetical protein AAF346_17975 [Pseudomonadota bacterium]
MTNLRIVEPGTEPNRITTALFQGELLVFQHLASLAQLLEQTRAAVETALETSDPLRAEQNFAPAEFRRRCVALRKVIEQDASIQGLWRAVLGEIGFDADDCFHDRLRLRIVPSKAVPEGRVIRPLPLHRDTWGSGIMAQVNWWLPIYPLTETRTMKLWPEAFDKPVANSSRTWDFEQLMSGGQQDYPMLPSTNETMGTPVSVTIKPGEVLAFAAAHLHAGINDTSGLSRISFDTRTVWQEDLIAGRAAPNVDGQGKDQHWSWFTPPRNHGRSEKTKQEQQTGATS